MARSSESFDAVILALPFTKLRQVKGLGAPAARREKLKSIRELGYGDERQDHERHHIARVAEPELGTSRAIEWRLLFRSRLPELLREQAAPSRARRHPHQLPGRKAGLTDAKSALDVFRSGLAEDVAEDRRKSRPSAVTSWFWATYPFTLGSYASAKVGQYTTMLEVAAEPALNGRLQFAGEHTSSDFLGYMNGGVESGNRASAALIEIMALQSELGTRDRRREA